VNHAAWVRELEDYADIVWGSTWEDESNALAGWFHLRQIEYPHIDLSFGAGSSFQTWKLPAVANWIINNVSDAQKVVWVEDEVFDDAFKWAAQYPNLLLIQTDPAVGLTREHVDSIKAFLS
jgi:hypothetical protein